MLIINDLFGFGDIYIWLYFCPSEGSILNRNLQECCSVAGWGIQIYPQIFPFSPYFLLLQQLLCPNPLAATREFILQHQHFSCTGQINQCRGLNVWKTWYFATNFSRGLGAPVRKMRTPGWAVSPQYLWSTHTTRKRIKDTKLKIHQSGFGEISARYMCELCRQSTLKKKKKKKQRKLAFKRRGDIVNGNQHIKKI